MTQTDAIELRAVSKNFGAIKAVQDISIVVKKGEFFSMVGPSGSGKTSCLRILAGFDRPSSGTVLLGGRDVTHSPPHERDVNTVFQDYALFPHLTVVQNVEFGMRMRGEPKIERNRRAKEALAKVDLADCGERRPSQLSGGQRQRVALARAIVNRPSVLLLDEPLGALDMRLRERMQIELRTLHRSLGITFIYVTHDQGEAMSMSDRVAVFADGRMEQIASPEQLYRQPETEFVASFVGGANVLSGKIAVLFGCSSHEALAIRPEVIQVIPDGSEIPEEHLSLPGRLLDVQYHGATNRWEVDIGGALLVASISSTYIGDVLPSDIGRSVRVYWPSGAMVRVRRQAPLLTGTELNA